MLDPKLLSECLVKPNPNKLIKDWTHSPSDTDEIIQEMLKTRQEQTDVDQEYEQERQRRMYSMLRNSSHFKKLQVIHANQHWSMDVQELDELTEALDDVGLDAFTLPRRSAGSKAAVRRVSFSDHNLSIPNHRLSSQCTMHSSKLNSISQCDTKENQPKRRRSLSILSSIKKFFKSSAYPDRPSRTNSAT